MIMERLRSVLRKQLRVEERNWWKPTPFFSDILSPLILIVISKKAEYVSTYVEKIHIYVCTVRQKKDQPWNIPIVVSHHNRQKTVEWYDHLISLPSLPQQWSFIASFVWNGQWWVILCKKLILHRNIPYKFNSIIIFKREFEIPRIRKLMILQVREEYPLCDLKCDQQHYTLSVCK